MCRNLGLWVWWRPPKCRDSIEIDKQCQSITVLHFSGWTGNLLQCCGARTLWSVGLKMGNSSWGPWTMGEVQIWVATCNSEGIAVSGKAARLCSKWGWESWSTLRAGNSTLRILKASFHLLPHWNIFTDFFLSRYFEKVSLCNSPECP